MKQSKLNLPLLLLLVTNLYTASAKLFVYVNADHLSSAIPGFEYPNNDVNLDVVWLFTHSIRLNINQFHLNGHSGDFVLISDLPLLDANDFKEMNETDDGYVNKLARSIVTDQGLLLSWKVNKTIEVINEHGTFVLFHAEAKEPEWIADFKGFEIEAIDYDQTITTTTTRAPDPYLPNPNGEETYITKYLDCKKPFDFLKDLDDFKEKIANLATNYCNEFAIPQCVDEKGNINETEVNIPGAKEDTYAGLHYCDSTWSNYETCVEVTFSITRLDNEGNYVLPANRLEQMWATRSHELVNYGYCPYDPPEAVVDLNTIVWIAFFLGVILSLSLLLGLAWIKNTRSLIEYRRSFMTDTSEENKQMKKVSDDKSQQPKPHDPDNNPIYKIIPKTYFSHDQLYPPSDYLQVDEEDTSTGPFKKSSTDNPYFEDVHADVYAYDNSVYEQDEGLGPLPTTRKEETRLYMRPRTSHASQSDTEI